MEGPDSTAATKSHQVGDTSAKLNNLTHRIWPPTQRTRDAAINRLIETLSSSKSLLSKRYGTIPKEEASAAAVSIEQEAFSLARASFSGEDDNGMEILQVYSKEMSKRMLDTVKARAASTTSTAAPSDSAQVDSNNAVSAGGEEFISSSTKAEA
ncbi:hypothetical protein ERO13_D05G264900v2 [Gossypium hirsutum]|uniref:MFP1 attachment factor 1 n=1 Tax=Gossypium hirsutum TaxID=3635 RepID=A0ABM3A6B5_GOSHI|nr:MFP1 attachment factor 1-like [Gossypium hirsutum]KAG4148090.1 hypothetical protein ERO13_D05G264900v2 [Gossypium hirsutum]